MDVLELPRPVINFLRTMAKESCRYALSWDIFGGPDSVTLTLTWKLIDDEVQSSIINETSSPSSLSSLKQRQQQQQQQQNDDNPNTRPRSAVKENTRSSSPRRSRRDENTFTNENISVPAIFRSSRGKSLEGGHIQPTKPMVSHQQHIKEHQTIINHQQQHLSKKEQQQPISTKSDQIYGNLYDSRSTSVVKCATVSSLSSSSPSPQPNNNNNNPPLSVAYTPHQRPKQPQRQSITPPTVRKSINSLVNTSQIPAIPSTNTSTNTSSNYTKLRRNDNLTIHDNMTPTSTTTNNNNNDDEGDGGTDPWVKRFECLFDDNDDDESTEHSEDKEALSATTNNVEECGNTSGKVKFKTKPDYF
ncbi:unnamed protein product [Rotaria magnacalcarata]|uniref:Uncharacterized protein n=5 Tax=Rotaria magnacalcarata TaxID=392030 RepID=A0A816VUW6_9BILA|nr:unnamed protein product [Rotaria magnacalcarata]CAF1386383.1 unnamed protein product [Rotaria magnacalcarata]CAF2127193.1 unnamed protein product [Rotaria magnacalcarata]